MDAIQEKTIGDYTAKVFYDDDPVDWREECDNFGNMICFHNSYSLGDDHNLDIDELKEIVNRKDVIALPLFLYDHGGITMSTGSFSCGWDSGQVGWIYVDYKEIRKEYGWKNITAKRKGDILRYLESEVKAYDKYLTGQIFGYIVEKDGENVESCWGFDDQDYCMDEAISIIEWHIKNEIKIHLEKVKSWITNKVPLIYRSSCPVQSFVPTMIKIFD